MNALICLLLFFVSQQAITDTVNIRSDNQLSEKVAELRDSIRHQQSKIEILESRIAQASDTINNLDTQLGSYLTVGSIFLTLIGIVIPFAAYFFVIKPQKELKSTINKRIQKYIESKRKKRVDEAIKGLQSESKFDVQKAVTILQLEGQVLTEKQLLKLTTVLNTADFDDTVVIPIANILTLQKSDHVREFFSEGLLLVSNFKFKDLAVKFFMRNNDLAELREIAKASFDKPGLFENILGSYMQDPAVLRRVLDDKELVDISFDGLKTEDLRTFANQIEYVIVISHRTLSSEEFNSTYFKKRYFQLDPPPPRVSIHR